VTADELLGALEAALARADGEVELSALATRSGNTRFANLAVTQTGSVADVAVQARVAIGGNLGAARCNALDPDAIAQAIARAEEIARAQPPLAREHAPFDDGAQPTPEVAPSWDEATAQASAADRARLVEPAFAAARRRGFSAAGLAATSESVLAVATRAGCRRAFRYTTSRLDVIAAASSSIDAASGRIGRFATAIGKVQAEAEAVAEEACARAERGRDPIDLPPDAYDVILEPAAVAELLEWLALASGGARAVEDGSSCLAGRAGERLTGSEVTFYDDALDGEEGCPTLPFDAEGTPKRRVALIERGLGGGPVHDRASAARAKIVSTGHAVPIGDELHDSGPVPAHLHMAAGADEVAALLARVERGLWVSRFHYVNGLIDTRRALMTGMTRDGLFLVESGRLSRGVRNLRFTESLLEAFGRLGGVTRARELVAASLGDAVFVCPTVLVRGWRFTGRAR
jgi:predicted Zn-dependent protease